MIKGFPSSGKRTLNPEAVVDPQHPTYAAADGLDVTRIAADEALDPGQ